MNNADFLSTIFLINFAEIFEIQSRVYFRWAWENVRIVTRDPFWRGCPVKFCQQTRAIVVSHNLVPLNDQNSSFLTGVFLRVWYTVKPIIVTALTAAGRFPDYIEECLQPREIMQELWDELINEQINENRKKLISNYAVAVIN